MKALIKTSKTKTGMFLIVLLVVTLVALGWSLVGLNVTTNPEKIQGIETTHTETIATESYPDPVISISPSPTPVKQQQQIQSQNPVASLQKTHTQLINAKVSKSETDTGSVKDFAIGNLAASSYTVYKIPVATSIETYGLIWDSGNLVFSWDGKKFQAPDLITDDKPDNFKKQATNLYFRSFKPDYLYVKTDSGINGLKLSLVKTPEHAEDYAVTSGGSIYSGATITELPIISRQQWGADESWSLWNPYYYPVNKIIVHHTAGSNNASSWPAVVRAIYHYHAVSLDWSDIGYNYLIDPEGNIYEGRKGGDQAVGAHAYGENYGSVGISMIGDFTNVGPTHAAKAALRKLVAEKSTLHSIDSVVWHNNYFGHRDFAATACPGNKLYPMLQQMVPVINDLKVSLYTDLATSIDETDAYFDTLPRGSESMNNLRIEFDLPVSVQEHEVRNLIPDYSGIEKVDVIGNVAYLKLTKYYINDEMKDYKLKFLYTYFKETNLTNSIQVIGDYYI